MSCCWRASLGVQAVTSRWHEKYTFLTNSGAPFVFTANKHANNARKTANKKDSQKGHALERKKQKNYSTLYSRVVSHRSTDNAITGLTSEIGRDPVLFGVYGRS